MFEREIEACKVCGKLPYPSPNPQYEGKYEHLCSTGALVLKDPEFPKSLGAKDTKEFMNSSKDDKRNPKDPKDPKDIKLK